MSKNDQQKQLLGFHELLDQQGLLGKNGFIWDSKKELWMNPIPNDLRYKFFSEHRIALSDFNSSFVMESEYKAILGRAKNLKISYKEINPEMRFPRMVINILIKYAKSKIDKLLTKDNEADSFFHVALILGQLNNIFCASGDELSNENHSLLKLICNCVKRQFSFSCSNIEIDLYDNLIKVAKHYEPRIPFGAKDRQPSYSEVIEFTRWDEGEDQFYEYGVENLPMFSPEQKYPRNEIININVETKGVRMESKVAEPRKKSMKNSAWIVKNNAKKNITDFLEKINQQKQEIQDAKRNADIAIRNANIAIECAQVALEEAKVAQSLIVKVKEEVMDAVDKRIRAIMPEMFAYLSKTLKEYDQKIDKVLKKAEDDNLKLEKRVITIETNLEKLSELVKSNASLAIPNAPPLSHDDTTSIRGRSALTDSKGSALPPAKEVANNESKVVSPSSNIQTTLSSHDEMIRKLLRDDFISRRQQIEPDDSDAEGFEDPAEASTHDTDQMTGSTLEHITNDTSASSATTVSSSSNQNTISSNPHTVLNSSSNSSASRNKSVPPFVKMNTMKL